MTNSFVHQLTDMSLYWTYASDVKKIMEYWYQAGQGQEEEMSLDE